MFNCYIHAWVNSCTIYDICSKYNQYSKQRNYSRSHTSNTTDTPFNATASSFSSSPCLAKDTTIIVDVYSGMTRTMHFKANQTSKTLQGISVVLKCQLVCKRTSLLKLPIQRQCDIIVDVASETAKKILIGQNTQEYLKT